MCRAAPTIDLKVHVPSAIPFDVELDKVVRDANPAAHRAAAAREDALDSELQRQIVEHIPLLELRTVKAPSGEVMLPRLDAGKHITLYFSGTQAAQMAQIAKLPRPHNQVRKFGACCSDGTGHLMNLSWSRFTSMNRTCFKARFQVGEPIQLLALETHDNADQSPPASAIRHATVRLMQPL